MDEIFELIMKEARSRPGDDIVLSTKIVLLEINIRVSDALPEMDQAEMAALIETAKHTKKLRQ